MNDVSENVVKQLISLCWNLCEKDLADFLNCVKEELDKSDEDIFDKLDQDSISNSALVENISLSDFIEEKSIEWVDLWEFMLSDCENTLNMDEFCDYICEHLNSDDLKIMFKKHFKEIKDKAHNDAVDEGKLDAVEHIYLWMKCQFGLPNIKKILVKDNVLPNSQE